MAKQRFRIIAEQPVKQCHYCNERGSYVWGGWAACKRHSSEDAIIRTMMRRAVTAVKQVIGSEYNVTISVTRKSDGKKW